MKLKIKYFKPNGVKVIYSVEDHYLEVKGVYPDKKTYLKIDNDYDRFLRQKNWYDSFVSKVNPITNMLKPYADVEFSLKILNKILEDYSNV